MKLLLDLGHSRLKWALDNDTPLAVRTLDWRERQFAATLEHDWRQLEQPATIVAAGSSDHPAREALSRVLDQCFAARPQWLVSPLSLAGIRNAYAEPGRLGIDRFLAMLAAWNAGLAPCIVADCGTALTLDALAADGQHLGGLIVPGASAMRHGLQTQVPVLAGIKGGEIVDCAKSTADAVRSGCAHAVTGAIERFHRRIAAQLGAAPTVVLCGGDAGILVAQLDIPATVIEHAALRGMQVWLQHT